MSLFEAGPGMEDLIHAYMKPHPEASGEWVVMFRPSIRSGAGFCPFFAVVENTPRKDLALRRFSESEARRVVKQLEGEMSTKDGSHEVV